MNDLGHGFPSWLVDSTHGRTMSGITCHHCPWAAHTVERNWAWHAYVTLRQYTWSEEVVGGMSS